MFTAKLKSQKKTPTLKNRAQAFCFLWGWLLLSVLHHGRLPPRPWREDSPTTSRIRNKKKEKGRKMAEVSFALLCPSRTAEHSRESLSDCGLNPTLPEFDCSRRWFIAPLFWLHMLRARPILGVCLLSQPFQCPSFGCA